MLFTQEKIIIGNTAYATHSENILQTLSFKDKTVFIDYETDMAKNNRPVTLTLMCAGENKAYLIVGFELIGYVVQKLKEASVVVAHNAHFEVAITYKWYNLLLPSVYCTMIAHQCLYNDPKENNLHSFGALVEAYFKVKLDKSSQTSFQTGVELTAKQVKYAFDDVLYLQPLYNRLDSEIEHNNQQMEISLECGIIPPLAKAEVLGIKLDIEQINRNIANWKAELVEVEANVKAEWEKFLPLVNPYKPTQPLNLNSSQQVKFLFLFLGYVSNELKEQIKFNTFIQESDLEYNPIVKGTIPLNPYTGKDTTGSGYLKTWLETNLDTPLWDFIHHLFRFKALNKLISQYGYGFLKEAKEGIVRSTLHTTREKEYRVHSKYLQRFTNTGRFSSTKPNIQNLPRLKEVRNMLVADEGFKFLIADFSGQEVLIAADKSKEPVLVDALTKGLDHHSFLATGIYKIIFDKEVLVSKGKEPLQEVPNLQGTISTYTPVELRNSGKGNLFTKFYGGGAAKMLVNMMPYIKNHVLPKDRMAVGQKMAAYFTAKLPVLTKWLKSNLELYEIQGYITPSIVGRRIRFKQRAYGDILNAPIQGTGADAMKLAIFYIHNYIIENNLEKYVIYLFNVHDEVILQIADTHLHLVPIFIDLMKQALDDLLSDEGKELGLKAEVEYEVTDKYTK